tara:strand:- start:744 stop:1991 length:1248 start_codon:yes stop_codon:yes gene_type:complete
MSPIAYKLLQESRVESVKFINYKIPVTYKNDYRVIFLESNDRFLYFNLIDLIKDADLDEENETFFDVVNKALMKIPRLRGAINRSKRTIKKLKKQKVGSGYQPKYSEIYSNFDFDSIIQGSKENVIFLFDQSNSALLDNAYDYTKKYQIPIGLLMHGLNPTDNYLMGNEMLNIDKLKDASTDLNKCDTFFVNNNHYKNRCAFHGIDEKKIQMCGSARFSNEWSNILNEITPSSILPQLSSEYVKVVVMLNKFHYNTWYEETVRVVNTLLSMKDVFVIVKPQTRNMSFDFSNDSENLLIVDNNIHSRDLIKWSDVTLFGISSIFLDALLLDKPLLHLRLTTSNRLACHNIIKTWNIDCRDDLLTWIKRFSDDPNSRTYTDEERLKCLNNYVNDADNKVLDRYTEKILSMKPKELLH